MQITDIKIRKFFDEGPMKAVVSVTLDDSIAIHDIKIVDGNEGCFVAMPSRKASDGEYRDIAHPINAEARAELIDVIIKAYNEELAKA